MPCRPTKGKVLRRGNSLVICITQAIARRAGLKAGDVVELTATQGAISLRRRVPGVPTLAELVNQITPENRHPEIAVGPLRGKESPTW